MPRHAPTIYSFYGRGGWNPEKKRILDSVVLPEKCRCFECDKIKTTVAAFSEKQLNDLRNGIASGQVPSSTVGGWITCRSCVGIQKHEMECILCEKVKSLDDFAKTHRRDPDRARCKACMTEQVNLAPSREVPKNEGEAEYASDDGYDSDDSRTNAYSSIMTETEDLDSKAGVALPDDLLADDLHTLNISRDNSMKPGSKASTTQSMAGTGHSTSHASTTGIQGWQTMSRQHGGENIKPHQFTAYDAKGKAHIKDISSSTSTFDEDSDDTTTPGPKAMKDKPEPTFPKIKTTQRKLAVPITHEGRNVNYDTDDDDDDESERDDYFAY